MQPNPIYCIFAKHFAENVELQTKIVFYKFKT